MNEQLPLAPPGASWQMMLDLVRDDRASACTRLRPVEAWTEADGPVLWWPKDGGTGYVGRHGKPVRTESFAGWTPLPRVVGLGEK